MSLDRPSGSDPQSSSHEMIGVSQAQTAGSSISGVSNEMLRLYLEAFGREPTRVRTYVQPEFCVCVLRGILTSAERSLVARDKAGEVEAARGMINKGLDAEFIDLVERQTGRPVLSHLARFKPAADVVVHFFLFDDYSVPSDAVEN